MLKVPWAWFAGMLALVIPLFRRLFRLFHTFPTSKWNTFGDMCIRLSHDCLNNSDLMFYFYVCVCFFLLFGRKEGKLCWNNNRGQVVKNATEIIVMLRVKFCSCLCSRRRRRCLANVSRQENRGKALSWREISTGPGAARMSRTVAGWLACSLIRSCALFLSLGQKVRCK